jgi:hypothetical protein
MLALGNDHQHSQQCVTRTKGVQNAYTPLMMLARFGAIEPAVSLMSSHCTPDNAIINIASVGSVMHMN